jgi:hypothetical protein
VVLLPSAPRLLGCSPSFGTLRSRSTRWTPTGGPCRGAGPWSGGCGRQPGEPVAPCQATARRRGCRGRPLATCVTAHPCCAGRRLGHLASARVGSGWRVWAQAGACWVGLALVRSGLSCNALDASRLTLRVLSEHCSPSLVFTRLSTPFKAERCGTTAQGRPMDIPARSQRPAQGF